MEESYACNFSLPWKDIGSVYRNTVNECFGRAASTELPCRIRCYVSGAGLETGVFSLTSFLGEK